MAKTHNKAAARTSALLNETGAAIVDPLLLLWSLTALTLAIILAYSHVFPQGAYPAHGIVPSLGQIVLAAAGVLILLRAPWIGPRTLAPMLLPCVLLVWAWWRTARARVPTEGIGLLGTLLEGCLVFAIALILAAVGKGLTSLRPGRPGTGEKEKARPPRTGRPGRDDERPPAAGHAQSMDAPRFLDGVYVFFLILAVGMALWAIYEYFVRYEIQYAEFLRSLGERGLSDVDVPAKDWALLEALRGKRVGARFGNPNVLAAFLSMVAPLAIAAALVWRDRSSRAAALGVLGLIWYVVILTGSRGGILTVLLATGGGALVAGRRTWRRQAATFVVAAAMCAAAVLAALVSSTIAAQPAPRETGEPVPRPKYTLVERLLGSPTVSQRFYYWHSAWPMIRQSPWLGHGLGSYAVLYPKYKQPLARETRYPHNIVVHLWVELGLVGLVVWIAWVGVVVGVAVGLVRRERDGPLGIEAKMLLVAAATFVINNLFEMTWAFRETYLDWCLITGVLAGLGAPSASSTAVAASSGAPGATTPRASLAIAAIPLLLGVTSANSLLLCPMIAESCHRSATDLVTSGWPAATARQDALLLAYKMIRYAPANPWFHHWLASFYRDIGDTAQARAQYETALQLHPDSAAIRADFAGFERKQGHPDRARRLLTDALELYPLNAHYHYLLADLEREAGNREAARDHIERALQCALDARVKPQYEQFQRDIETTGSVQTNRAP